MRSTTARAWVLFPAIALFAIVASSIAAAAAPRDLYNTVNALGQTFIYPDSFRAYVDSTWNRGFRELRVSGAWRVKCYLCAPDTLDFNVNPAAGVYDFSEYFSRLDYAILTRGMKMQVGFMLAGRLESDPVSPGAQRLLPGFLGAGDAMLYRNASAQDVVFSSGWESGNYTKTPRFEKASVRASMLDFVTQVVRQFRARYGDAVTGYLFTFGQYGESEYPLADYPYFCDTSPEAAQAFRTWLALHYASPTAVSTAWGHHPRFHTFDEIQILDGQASPVIGQAPPAYLDFMAYREQALADFLKGIRTRIHVEGGRAVAQLGSVWDVVSCTRGTFGFGREIPGFDLVIIDDGPEYDHRYSMDYTRTNAGGVPFGNELDGPCRFGCTASIDQCCNAQTFPASIDVPAGIAGIDAQVSQSYERGATWVDFANWDNFFHQAFPLFAQPLANAVALATLPVNTPVATDTQRVSLRALYTKHHNGSYVDSLIAAHAALGGSSRPIAVALDYDLAPPYVVGVTPVDRERALALGPLRPNPAAGSTDVAFELPSRARVSIGLFDAAGRRVATPVNAVLAAGEHHVALDTQQLPAGFYVVKLEAAGAVRSRKLTVSR